MKQNNSGAVRWKVVKNGEAGTSEEVMGAASPSIGSSKHCKVKPPAERNFYVLITPTDTLDTTVLGCNVNVKRRLHVEIN